MKIILVKSQQFKTDYTVKENATYREQVA